MKFFITIVPVRLLILTIALISLTQVKAYAQTVFYGDTVSLGAGFAFTWVETDAQSAPLRIGLSFTQEAISNPSPGLVSVDFPAAASDSLFKHAFFSYEPNGHEPAGVYTLPHFDMHFYMITRAERLTISHGTDPVPIQPSYIPEGYITLGGMFSIFQMGVHFVDSLAGELHGQPFDKTLLYGFYNGKMIFTEPMITRAFLLTNPDTLLPVKQPEAYQKTAYYPESYVVRFNTQNNMYEIFLTDFVQRTALTDADDATGIVTADYTLYQNYPNPFNPSTVIRFNAVSESRINIRVYNMLGELVEVLADGVRPAGNHSLTWNPGPGLSSGVYICKMEASEISGTKSFSDFRKMLLLR